MIVGFIEKANPCRLLSPFLPDKIGGRPAWLSLNNLPPQEVFQCEICKNVMVFILQVCQLTIESQFDQIYSPIDELAVCFHRFLYVFMCKNGSCFGEERTPFLLLRCQLPRRNDFYRFDPPPEISESTTPKDIASMIDRNLLNDFLCFQKTCSVCGIPADKYCSKCNKKYYCCREHQVLDWNSHKTLCPEQNQLKERISSLMQVNREGEEQDEETRALEEIARKATPEEKVMSKFKELMAEFPDQVIRFQREGTPFLLNQVQIPDCKACGSDMVFEFQITPQILTYLKLDKLGEKTPDFGTVLGYTCRNSCTPCQGAYQKEFIHCQYF
ncbi:Programmed cell death protein 2 [Cichlidogyrus casuarinus]|uniref:Programmed cell death protein 2 n=1 Tax=Cichlidogyrus casuarinus TaxID=1844966 RepID=A0ABD2QFE6_9PLAT